MSAAQDSTNAAQRAKRQLRCALLRHQFGVLHSDELPALATAALVAGLDTYSLSLLAGEMHPTWSDCADLFERIQRELEIPLSSRDVAALELARCYAEQILDGTLSPAQGAEHIWWDIANDFMTDERVWPALRGFVGLASEYRDHPEARAELEQKIRDEAQELLTSNI